MSRQVKKFLKKIFVLSAILALIFNIGDNLINANSSEKSNTETQKNENKNSFKSIGTPILGVSGVAISTNIGIRFKQTAELPVTIYKEVMSFEKALGNNNLAKKELIANNMLAIQEYKNVLQTSVKKLLSNSYDRKAILEAYIGQLEYRYENGVNHEKTLLNQRAILLQAMEKSNAQLDQLKQKIDTDFNNNDADESLKNIDTLLELKKKFYFARTYVVYINQFLNEYTKLNNYNKILLDVLINNKEAIIKDASIVIPNNGGLGSLKSFGLLFEEAEKKSK
ncbi:hypothetical protein A9Q91_03965 [Candidatus Gracilibacteria bacterium 28_42_T64]|nr:hypothetical protein A9Q91_03965 [Candidatus Gracilibacteria bacterium 28_42_T64]